MNLVNLDKQPATGLSHDADILKRVLLTEHELPASVRLSHAVFQPGQKASAHIHDDLVEVFYVISGSGEIIVDGVSHAITEGSAFHIDPGEVHELVNSGEQQLAVLYFGLKQT